MSLIPRYWWRKWCRVWWTWHLDIDDESDVEFEEADTSILMTKVMKCQTLQVLHHFRHQYRGVSLFKFYITFVINIEVSASSNSTSLSSSISRCQPLQVLHHFRHQYRGVSLFKFYIYFVRKWCRTWRVWHLDIDDEVDVEFEEADTSILMTKVM
jgi:hypothetical protein